MKRYPGMITLAIGDGANDTDMITAAHIGIGIAGVEGTAATNASDYAIGTFRMLHTLIFKHGLWAYYRIAKLVNFIFYKGSLLAISMYLYSLLSGFSGQQLFNDPPYQLYNIAFTAFPILGVAVFDQILPYNAAENNPLVFRAAKGKAFTATKFFSWIGRSILHTIIMFSIPFISLSHSSKYGLWSISTTILTIVAIVPNFIVIFIMTNINAISVFFIFGSIMSIFTFTYGLSKWLSYNPNLYGVIDEIYWDKYIWLIILLTTMIPFILELTYRFIKRQFSPSLAQVLQEKVVLSKNRIHPTEASIIDEDDEKNILKRFSLTKTKDSSHGVLNFLKILSLVLLDYQMLMNLILQI